MAQIKRMISVPLIHSKSFLAFVSATFFLILWMGSVEAAESIKFRNVNVKPYNETYVVTSDVSIRSLPNTKSKRLGRYKSGRRIQVVGLASSSWLAVREKGRDIGFVYKKYLLPLIDGTLESDLTGLAQSNEKPATNCKYTISFEGKSSVEGQFFEIADYDIIWKCKRAKKGVIFRTPMFIAEAPYKKSQKRIYQITIDVLDLDRGYDEILSTFILYDIEKRIVFFEGVSNKKYGSMSPASKFPVKSIAHALKVAAAIALKTWNKKAWKDLIKNMPKYSDPVPKKIIPKIK